MDLALIQDGERSSRTSKYLLKAIKDLGHKAYYVPLGLVNVEVGRETRVRVGTQEVNFDGILLRGLRSDISLEQYLARYAILKQVETLGIAMVNEVDPLFLARNKYLALLIACKAGIPVPDTILTESIATGYRTVKEWSDIVIKPIAGSRGVGSMRFNDPDMAFFAMKNLRIFSQPLMIQKYVHKPNRDVRVFVIGGHVVASMYRYAAPNSWKTNVAQGGKGVACNPGDQVKEIAIKVTEVFKLDYAGVDIVESEAGPLLLEVNASADFEELMRVTGVDIPRKIVQRLIEKIKK